MDCLQIAGSPTGPPCAAELLMDEAQNGSAFPNSNGRRLWKKKLSMKILVTSVLWLFNGPYGSNGPSHDVGGMHRFAEET